MHSIEQNEELKGQAPTYSAALREVIDSAKQLIRDELALAREEAKAVARKVIRHSAMAALFGALLAASILPFLAFLVIGLGDLLGGRYWLSSLLVAVFGAVTGGTVARWSFRKIVTEDLGMPATRRTLGREAEVIRGEFEKFQNPTTRSAI